LGDSLVVQGPLVDATAFRHLGPSLRALYVRQYGRNVDKDRELTTRSLFGDIRRQLTRLELLSDLRSPWLTEADESYGIVMVRPPNRSALIGDDRGQDWCMDNGIRTGWNGSVSSDMLARWSAEVASLDLA
jgi:hypothetical protein